jgi:hypothetical protein
MANHITATGMIAQAAIVAARRQPGCRMPSTRIVTAAAASTHCPIPPVVTQACALAHGAHVPEPQLNLSVQLEPIPKAAPNQPTVPSTNVTARASVTSATIHDRH